MSVRVDGLPPCTACGGKVFPLVLCNTCGAVTILRNAQSLESAARCSECGKPNPWQLICDECHTQFPGPGMPAGTTGAPAIGSTASGSAGEGSRPKRRIRGEVDIQAVGELLKVLGLDASRARALIDRGYDALWKIARAKEDQLARIPEVGPIAARKMVASFHLLNYAPPKRTKESIAQDEYECPLCGCVTSAFSLGCIECGAPFDEEEMEEDVRHAFAQEGPAGLLAFYDGRIAEHDDAELSYARGLLLESLDRVDEALVALDRAVSQAPDAKKIKVAQLRLQARHFHKPEAAAKLRSTASSLLDDVAWDQEIAQLDRVISEAERECPHCGAAVPAEMALCPSCGLRLSPPRPAPPPPTRPAPSPTPELDALVDDLLVGELEESLSVDELERTKAAVLDWLIEELEESMAPDVQVLSSPKTKAEGRPAEEAPQPPTPSPISDSIGFLSQWVRGSRGLVSGLRPKQGPRGAGRVNGVVNGQGRVNGLVNGVGRTNGLVNGVGRVNGLVNGMGRVNGLATPAGRVNGLMTSRGRVNGLVTGQGRINGVATGTQFVRPSLRLRLPYPSRRVRYLSIASAVLVAILIAGILFVPPSGPSTPISIDGSFGDWASVPMFAEATAASDVNVSIARYASLLDRDSLYLFASTQGGMFGDPADYNAVYFLIDGDGNASTGFQFDGVGADTVVGVFGSDHVVDGARLYSFPVGSEVNWSQRQSSGSAQAASSVQGLEVKVSTYDIDRFSPTQFRISIYADNFRGASSRSKADLNAANGAILLEPLPLASLVGGGPTNLFEIRVRALGVSPTSSWDLTSITRVSTPGVSVSLSPESVTLTQGHPNATISASVSAPGFFPGDAVQVDVTGATAQVPVFVNGPPVRAYVLSPPSFVRVDGLFADWIGSDHADSDPVAVKDPNVDIARYGAAVDASTVFFHVAVTGDLLAGKVPERVLRSLSGPGGNASGRPIPLPRVTGEDMLRVYVDLNASDAIGDPIGGILADYLFELRGQDGRVTTRALFAWTGLWQPVPLPAVALAKDETDVEGSLAIGPTTNRTRIVFATTDWSGIGDVTPPANATVQAPAPASGLSPPTINAPEFHEIAIPVVGTLLILVGFIRRRRRRE